MENGVSEALGVSVNKESAVTWPPLDASVPSFVLTIKNSHLHGCLWIPLFCHGKCLDSYLVACWGPQLFQGCYPFSPTAHPHSLTVIAENLRPRFVCFSFFKLLLSVPRWMNVNFESGTRTEQEDKGEVTSIVANTEGHQFTKRSLLRLRIG